MRSRAFLLSLLAGCFVLTLAGLAGSEEPGQWLQQGSEQKSEEISETRSETGVLLGRVERVDRERGEVTLSLVSGDRENGAEKDPETVTIRMEPGDIPGGVRPGRMVRAWGGFGTGGTGFSGVKIHPVRRISGRGGDPTGVRHRIRLRQRHGGRGTMGGGRR